MTGSARLWIALVAVAVGVTVVVAASLGGLTGTDRVWPVVVGAAVGLAPGSVTWRLATFVTGILVGWGAVALQVSVLPDRPAARVAAVLMAVAVVAAGSVATRDRAPMWIGLVGIAAFLAFTDAGSAPGVAAAVPAMLPADRLAAAGSLFLAAGIGAAGAVAARSVAALAVQGRPRPRVPAREADDEVER